jgi:hypothetical protein
LVTNEQLYLAIGVPLLFNATLIVILMAWINAKFEAVGAKFQSMEVRFTAIEKRLDDMKELWRAELHRVEEILDARLKHLEERH